MAKISANRLALVDRHRCQLAIYHHRKQLAGPSQLNLGNIPLLNSCGCEIDSINDTHGVVDSFRSWRKGNVFTIESRGHLAIPKKIDVTHTYRYGAGFVKITTDITLPKDFLLETKLGIGTLALSNHWQRYRFKHFKNGVLVLSQWQPIAAPKTGSQELFSSSSSPLSVIFQYNNFELEVFVGTHLWRWHNGVLGAENQGKFALVNHDNGLHFHRYVTTTNNPIEPAPRPYRFSWYLSWSLGEEQDSFDNLRKVAPLWNSTGDLDFSTISKLVKNLSPGTALEINLSDKRWHSSACRRYKNNLTQNVPCFVSNCTINRAKRLIRQLKGASEKPFPILFRGLEPGLCEIGPHVTRKGKYLHWDLPAAVDFSQWTRKTLGNGFEIMYQPDGELSPSMRNLFSAPSLEVNHGN